MGKNKNLSNFPNGIIFDANNSVLLTSPDYVAGGMLKVMPTTGEIVIGTPNVDYMTTSILATSPIFYNAGVISSQAANATQAGYLTSIDWTTFNNKGVGTVTSVTGTANQITVTGTTAPIISLPATITGLTSVTSTAFTGALTGHASLDLPLTAGAGSPLTGGLYGTSASFSGNIESTSLTASIIAGRTTGYGYFGNLTGGASVVFYGDTHTTKSNKTEITGAGGVVVLNALTGTSATFVGNVKSVHSTDATRYAQLVLDGVRSYGAQDMYIAQTGAYNILLATNGVTALTIASNQAATFSSTVTATGGFFNSDRRWKDFNDKTFDLDELKGQSFTWNEFSGKDDGKNHFTYIAQEVQKYMPDAISADEKGYLSVNYTEVHTAKIQRLEDRLKELEAKLNN